MNAVLYVHGQGGSAAEAEHYRRLFPSSDTIGLDYKGQTPWEAGEEIKEAVGVLKRGHGSVILIANSIGAFFCMNADIGGMIQKAYFISPVADMEKLILDMMKRADVSQSELRKKRTVRTERGDVLSWEYLSYVREHPIKWNAPTEILYGGRDNITSYETIAEFSKKHNARLTVMKNGEHWFHTEEQMRFLDNWILSGS